MADKRSLGLLGLLLIALTGAVLLISAAVVKGHIDGRLVLDGGAAPSSPGRSVR